jgi:hypothetical protein
MRTTEVLWELTQQAKKIHLRKEASGARMEVAGLLSTLMSVGELRDSVVEK